LPLFRWWATFGIMWFLRPFSLDKTSSLMALTVGTGFVVDDAIVMIEKHRSAIWRMARDPFEGRARRRAARIGLHP